MRAVILAAGKGSRLGAASNGMPKCLLQIGGKPLIFHQLECLSEAGVSPVLMVVGHGADIVRETVGSRVEYAFNPRYESTNSLASFLLAREWAKGSPLLVLNSDVLFDGEILDRMLKAGAPALAFDSTSGDGAEHMKVAIQEGRVVDISKQLPRDKAAGENVGLLCMSAAAAEQAFAKAQELMSNGVSNAFLAEAVRAALLEAPFKPVDVAGLPWVEIDSPFDLERARRDVWPLMKVREGTRVLAFRRRHRLAKVRLFCLAMIAAAAVFAGGWYLAGPGVAAWEHVRPAGAQSVALEVNETPQEWWFVPPGGEISVKVPGPQDVRIDFRGAVAEGSEASRPYVVEVRFNGTRDWHKWTATIDPDAKLAGYAVTDRDKLDVTIPEGEKNLTVRLVAGDFKGLLVRIRVPEISK